MKQRLLTLLCLLCCLSASTAWADTYSHEIAKKTWSAYDTQTLSNVDWTASATGGAYWGYDSSRGQQFGKGADPATSLSISTSFFTDKILSVKVSTSGAKDIAANLSLTVGGTNFKCNDSESVSITDTNTEYDFTGSATGDIVIKWEQTSSKALYLKKIEVVYGSEQPKLAPAFTTQPIGTEYDKDAVADPLSVEVSGYPIPTLQWYSNSAASVEGATAIEGATGKTYTPATATVGTTYYYCVAQNSEGSATSDIVSVVVNEVTLDGKGEGTAESPFDVSRALDYINKGFDSTVDLYVKGIISKVTEVNLKYGNATYLISFDGETTSSQLTIYRGYYLNNAAFTSADQIQASDTVVIVGKLIKYGTTSEMAQGNYIVSHKRDGKITPTLSFSPEEVTAYLDAPDEFKAPVLATDPEGLKVTYSMSGDAVGTIDADGTLHLNAAGTATVTATADDEAYGDAEATYTLKVVANKPVFVMLVAKAHDGRYYAMSSNKGVVDNSLKAIEVNVDNNRVYIENISDLDNSLLWLIEPSEKEGEDFIKAFDGSYLAGTSSNTNLITKIKTQANNWLYDNADNYWKIGSRSFLFKEKYSDDKPYPVFRNYSTNNLDTDGYAATYTIAMPYGPLFNVHEGTSTEGLVTNEIVVDGENYKANKIRLFDNVDYKLVYAVEANEVEYSRLLTSTTWTTICLPFDVPEAACDDYDVLQIFGANDDAIVFEYTSAMVKHTPYLIKKKDTFTDRNLAFEITGTITVDATTDEAEAVIDDVKLVGIYKAQTIPEDGNSYGISGGVFKKPAKDNPNKLKAYRAYLQFINTPQAEMLKIKVNDGTEGIGSIVSDVEDGVFYDLYGRKVNNPTTGIYIFNGTKVYVK